MQRILAGLLFVAFSASAEDLSKVKELYTDNGQGGFIALTTEPCKDTNVAKMFPYHAYTSDDEVGCWFVPSLEGAPKGAFPLVNIYAYGEVYHYPQALFTPNKPKLGVKGDF